jgi:cis-L-3-hydroxyproline dehydratase
VKLTAEEHAMLDSERGPALQRAMEGLVQLAEAFDAADIVQIGYAHDLELLAELVPLGARVSVPTSANVANVDTVNWKMTGAPEALARVHMRGVAAP